MFLFDTDHLSGLMRPEPLQGLVARVRSLPPRQRLTTSINLGELFYGAYRVPASRERRLAAIGDLLRTIQRVLPFDRIAAERYGQLRAELERQGRPLADADLRIAAIALAHGLTIVTGNTRHFERVPGLTIENWLQP